MAHEHEEGLNIDLSQVITAEGGISTLLLLETVFFVPAFVAVLFFPKPGLLITAALAVLTVATVLFSRRNKRA